MRHTHRPPHGELEEEEPEEGEEEVLSEPACSSWYLAL